MVGGFTTTCASEFKPVHGEVYSIQHYVKKFVSNLRQVGGFFWALRFPSQFIKHKLPQTGYIV